MIIILVPILWHPGSDFNHPEATIEEGIVLTSHSLCAINGTFDKKKMDSLRTVLKSMPYPGRVILLGLDRTGESVVVAYAITGRSASSQARILRLQGSSIWTEPTQDAVLEQGKKELLVYRAIAVGGAIVISNGRQTEGIVNAIGPAKEPMDILKLGLDGWTYEPDAPHFTPRISGLATSEGQACLSLIRRGNQGSEERLFFPWKLEPGRGKLVATYSGREEYPLPPFDREPVDIPILSPDAITMAQEVDISLAPAPSASDYRVAVASVFAPVRDFLSFRAYIINKKER